MGFSPLPENTRELWKDWGLRLFVLLSLFLQLTLVTQGFRRKSIYKYWIQVMVWMTYLSAESIAILTLGILSNRLANVKDTKGTINPKSQITAFRAPFLLLHLGGPNTIIAYALADNKLWLRQLVRLCVQVGLAWSVLSILAAGVILVGFIKYAERTLCLHLVTEGRLRDSMLSLPDFCPIYHGIIEQYTLKKEEGYRVCIDEVMEVPAPEDLSVNSGQTIDKEKDRTLVKAYELFKIFKLLFVGLILNSGDQEANGTEDWSGLTSLDLKASEELMRSNNNHLIWSVKDIEFDCSILIWHIATELCHYKDLDQTTKMSKLVSRYMLYLLAPHPSMLPTGIEVLRYEDTSVNAHKFFEDKLLVSSKKETSIRSSVVKTRAQNLFKKEKYGHTGVKSCNKVHKSTESGDLCEACHLLLQVGIQLPAMKIRSGKSRSVLFDACHLASQLNEIESKDFGWKWYLIGKVWAKFLIYTAYQSKGYKHFESLRRGGELVSHIWLLMAHLRVAEPMQNSEAQWITKLILN
ncbi:hypothetical protein EUGRSUZ_J02414 [Eucalyptus grandis]|uniref:DUF4220 domain-containing protein n=2 Tax=Eucalyptus grandis TaxID=71139 RepID=A0A059AGE3_EUCGR|nr:hypothetical protein EUGRSUZ_J02414 [Eucalyptus grandis]